MEEGGGVGGGDEKQGRREERSVEEERGGEVSSTVPDSRSTRPPVADPSLPFLSCNSTPKPHLRLHLHLSSPPTPAPDLYRTSLRTPLPPPSHLATPLSPSSIFRLPLSLRSDPGTSGTERRPSRRQARFSRTTSRSTAFPSWRLFHLQRRRLGGGRAVRGGLRPDGRKRRSF